MKQVEIRRNRSFCPNKGQLRNKTPLGIETKMAILHSLHDFSRFFQQNVLVLDMASGRIDDSQVSYDKE